MTLYQRYARLPIRFGELGLERGSEKSSYFCTPKGARVIGWAGVDGIHFCFVPGHGDMVFAVSPMAAGDYVQVVGRNFEDFLRLVLACGGSAAIEQARYWTRKQFEAYLGAENAAEYPPCADALHLMAERLALTEMPDPYGYLTALRESFDCSALQPREEPAAPKRENAPFPVVWDSSVHDRPRLRRAAKEVAVNASFSWGVEEWCVPRLYLCAEGIMVDFCVGIEAEKVKEFLRRYEELGGGDYGAELAKEQREELERYHPLQIDFHAVLTVDGHELRQKGGSSTFWVPQDCGSEELTDNNASSRVLMEHYELDENKAWVFWRCSFPWKGRHGSARRVTLTLTRDKEAVTLARFTDPQVGEEILLIHPATETVHVLRVAETGNEELDAALFRDPDTEYPTQFATLQGTVTPPLEDLTVRDCAEGDRPRSKNGSAAFAIQLFARRDKVKQETGKEQVWGASSFYFDAPQSLTWRIIVNQKPLEDVEIQLK